MAQTTVKTSQINLAGVRASTGGGARFTGPKGKYQVTCTGMSMKVSEDGSGDEKYRFHLTITSPTGGKGGTITKTMPSHANEKGAGFWRAAYESAGYTAAQLEKGKVTIGEPAFKGKTMYIFFSPKAPGERFDNVEFLPLDVAKSTPWADYDNWNPTTGTTPAGHGANSNADTGFEGGAEA